MTILGHYFTWRELWFIGAAALFVINWCGALIALAMAPV